MKILIDIQSNSTLLWHEALSMAFALATFEHEICLNIGADFLDFLMSNPEHSLANMLSSLDLYDIFVLWRDDKALQKLALPFLEQKVDDLSDFETVFVL